MPEVDPNYPTLPILAMVLTAGLISSGVGVLGLPAVAQEIATGRAYSAAVVFGDSTRISRAASPITFWSNVTFQGASGVVGIVLGPLTIVNIISAYRKRRALERESDDAVNSPEKTLPNQSSEPTPFSVTPPAGQESRPR